MKKIFFIISVFLAEFSFAQWVNVGSSSVSSGWTVYNDIAIDTSNAPVIVYNENALNNYACLRYNGAQWLQVGSSSFSFPFGYNFQLLIDSLNNNYYISFYDLNNNLPSVIRFNGTSWNYVSSQYLSNQSVNDFNMCVDKNGVLYCSFLSSSGFQLLKENGSSWQTINTTGLITPLAHMSMTIDKQNNLLLAFTNMNNLSANCMKLNGSIWQQLGNANFTSGGFAQYNKVKVSESNEVFVATQNLTTVCYKLNSNNVWQQLGASGLGINCIGVDDLVIKNNSPFILTSQIAGDKARCFYFNGTNWFQSCNASVSDTTASSAAMELDKHSAIYVVYNDYVGGKANVRKCGSISGVNEETKAADIKIYPNPTHDILNVELESKSLLRIYNSLGQLILETNLVKGNNSLNLVQFNRGVYFVSIYDDSFKKLICKQKVILIE